jgi:hypothetical protein
METLSLASGSDIKVWRKGAGWSGLHKFILTNGQDITMDIGNGSIIFRAMLVQQYLRDSKDETDYLIRLPYRLSYSDSP